ncbi:hypothetical protein MHPYR_230075 [uncultured Mycobacterium sp.]|uniref:Uncharacterized protein n=1 Tax=uncultured Mycobacterium sp. TaxID=171292 RepID=A0A1Y5P9X7_9MYCO|nr:hypothetical protein MHPYR_230075 [uncultured Mycobacterium sp.]
MLPHVGEHAGPGHGGHVRAERLAAPVGRRARVQQPQPGPRGGVPRDVAVPEHQHVGAGIALRHPGFPARGGTGLMDDGEAQAVQRHVGAFGQPGPQFRAVVVAPAGDQAVGPRRQFVEQALVDPVAGVDDDVGALDFVPYGFGQVAGAFGDVSVGHQQQTHRPILSLTSALCASLGTQTRVLVERSRGIFHWLAERERSIKLPRPLGWERR